MRVLDLQITKVIDWEEVCPKCGKQFWEAKFYPRTVDFYGGYETPEYIKMTCVNCPF